MNLAHWWKIKRLNPSDLALEAARLINEQGHGKGRTHTEQPWQKAWEGRLCVTGAVQHAAHKLTGIDPYEFPTYLRAWEKRRQQVLKAVVETGMYQDSPRSDNSAYDWQTNAIRQVTLWNDDAKRTALEVIVALREASINLK